MTRLPYGDNVEGHMKISSSSGAWMATVMRGSLVLGLAGFLVGCASSSTTTSGGTTTPAASGGQKAGGEKQNGQAKAVEEDALVRLKPNMFPPVDVGAWVCEPQGWTDKGVHLHCTAPAGSTSLLAALREMPGVESAESTK